MRRRKVVERVEQEPQPGQTVTNEQAIKYVLRYGEAKHHLIAAREALLHAMTVTPWEDNVYTIKQLLDGVAEEIKNHKQKFAESTGTEDSSKDW